MFVVLTREWSAVYRSERVIPEAKTAPYRNQLPKATGAA